MSSLMPSCGCGASERQSGAYKEKGRLTDLDVIGARRLELRPAPWRQAVIAPGESAEPTLTHTTSRSAEHCHPARVAFPPAHRNIDVFWLEFNDLGATGGLLRGDDGGAGSADERGGGRCP